MEKYYKIVPIHKQSQFLDETIRLINSHWQKSRSERLSILSGSKDDLPMSLVMVFAKNKSDISKENTMINDIFFESQNIHAPIVCSETGKPINVLGHLRLVSVPSDEKACFIESMIIREDFRGKGLGTYFLRQTEKFCEEVLHMKSIYLSTYDSGEFYMKIGFSMTNAICVYGNGEVNNVSKKIYLKKDLNYVEPEEVEEEIKEIYDPTKDYNYNQQKQMENDIILSGFPFKVERPKSYIDRFCELLDFDLQKIKYYYSYELYKREKEKRSFHMMISAVTYEAKVELLQKLDSFGIMCFQDFFERPVNEWDNTIITHATRYTNLNYIILKELKNLKADRWIADYKYENCQFHANQNEQWMIVRNLEIIDVLRTPEIPDVPDEKITLWDDVPEDNLMDNLEKMKESLKKLERNNNWLTALRRPSEIKLEPLYRDDEKSSLNQTESTSCRNIEIFLQQQQKRWVEKLRCSNDSIMLGLNLNDV